jgi:putative flippase GtrA
MPNNASLPNLATVDAGNRMYSDDPRDSRLSALAGQVYASSLFRFLAVGTFGFFTDAAFVYAFVYLLGLHYVVGRLLSFSIAVGVTLLLNRAWTFRVVRDRPVSRSIVYVVAQILGGAVNIAVYAASASAVPILKSWLIIPLALGSGFGLLVTYSMSRYVAFRPTNI